MAQEIIVCDDEPHIVRAISLKLTRAGFDVKGASDVEACWRLLHRHAVPELLIVDDSMPTGPNALELVRRVRSDAQLCDLPIVMLTSKDSRQIDPAELLALNISHTVSKPFSPRELLAIVDRLVTQDSKPKAPYFGSERISRYAMQD